VGKDNGDSQRQCCFIFRTFALYQFALAPEVEPADSA
jgi:hypothetical protein